MLQKRINELKSGILTMDGDKVHVMGFNNEGMLLSFLNNNKKNWSSIGLYDFQNKPLEIKNQFLTFYKKSLEKL